MTEDQARKLAERIIDTWPGGARAYVWRDVLFALDHHAADVTVRLLTKSATSPPTPGTFLVAYKSQRARLMEPQQLTIAVDEERIGPNGYLDRLRERAQQDPASAEELAALERVARRSRRLQSTGLSTFGARDHQEDS